MVPVQPCPGVHREELRQEGVGASEGAQEAAELHEAAPRVLGFKPLEQVVQVLAQESVEARRQKALHVNLLPQDVNLALCGRVPRQALPGELEAVRELQLEVLVHALQRGDLLERSEDVIREVEDQLVESKIHLRLQLADGLPM